MLPMRQYYCNAVGREQFKGAMASVAISLAVIVPILVRLVAGVDCELSLEWNFLVKCFQSPFLPCS